jgi:hypothetical protein
MDYLKVHQILLQLLKEGHEVENFVHKVDPL